jgi:hypothetical protein
MALIIRKSQYYVVLLHMKYILFISLLMTVVEVNFQPMVLSVHLCNALEVSRKSQHLCGSKTMDGVLTCPTEAVIIAPQSACKC